MQIEKIKVYSEFIKLDSLLKFANVCLSGGEAKQAITDGIVLVNDEICTMRGKKIYKGDVVIFDEQVKLIIE